MQLVVTVLTYNHPQVCLHDGSEGVGINSNFGDTATLSGISTDSHPSDSSVCCTYEGVSPGNEPDKIGWYDP